MIVQDLLLFPYQYEHRHKAWHDDACDLCWSRSICQSRLCEDMQMLRSWRKCCSELLYVTGMLLRPINCFVQDYGTVNEVKLDPHSMCGARLS